MRHIKDYTYKGHEVSIYQDGSKYAFDVRSDDFDGDIMQAYTDVRSESEALAQAMHYIDRVEALRAEGIIQ